MKLKTTVMAALFTLASAGAAIAQWVHPFDYPQAENYSKDIFAAIEIPAGSYTKYEIDATTSHVIVDHVASGGGAVPGQLRLDCAVGGRRWRPPRCAGLNPRADHAGQHYFGAPRGHFAHDRRRRSG